MFPDDEHTVEVHGIEVWWDDVSPSIAIQQSLNSHDPELAPSQALAIAARIAAVAVHRALRFGVFTPRGVQRMWDRRDRRTIQ